eukprot:359318-Chlamydomonas_euryale.AAC.3
MGGVFFLQLGSQQALTAGPAGGAAAAGVGQGEMSWPLDDGRVKFGWWGEWMGPGRWGGEVKLCGDTEVGATQVWARSGSRAVLWWCGQRVG